MRNSLAKKLFALGVALSTAIMGLTPAAVLAAPHAVGSNVLSSDGTVWFISPEGTRRAYTSGGAFLSYGFNSFSSVVTANSDDLALPQGSFIPPQDGKILCSDRGTDKGTCYLVTGGQKAGFTSASVFTGLGFSFSRAAYADLSWMGSTSNIDSSTQAHRPGVLVNKAGTVLLVGATGLLGIPDLATFNSWGYSFADVVPANAADNAMTQTGVMAARVAGQLNPTALSSGCPPNCGTVTGVTVSTSGSTPGAATVPQSATNVPFLKFVVNNTGSSAVTISQVTVTRTGAGATSDFDNVYVYQGSMRLTSGRSVNSSTNQAVFSSLNITVGAASSVTLDVTADINASAGSGNVHAFTAAVNLTTGTASGSATGNSMTIAGVDAGTITIAASGGTLTNPKVGQQNVKVAQFQLSASSAEDLTVRRISLFQGGNISRSNLTNFVLKTSTGTQLATVAALDSKDHITFDGLTYELAKGDSRVFEVYANVGGSAKANDTITIYLEEAVDLYAQGKTFGHGAAVTKTSYDNSPSNSSNASLTTVEGGQLTITFNGPASKDIGKNQKDVEVFNFTVAAQSNVEIRQLSVLFDNGASGTANFNDGTTPNFTDVKVWDGSTVVWGPTDLSGTGSSTFQDLLFTEDVVIGAGTSKTFKVTMDVANTSDIADGDKIRVQLDVSDLSSQVKNLDNNTFLADGDIVPSPTGADVAGNQLTVKVPALTITLATSPTSQSFIKGTNDVPFVGFNFTAGTGADIRVSSITVSCYIDEDAASTGVLATDNSVTCQQVVPNTRLKVDGAQVGDTKSVGASSGTATFSNLNLVIPAGTTKVVKVYGDISTSAYVNSNSEAVSYDIVTASTDISASDPEGNGVTASGSGVNGTTAQTRKVTINNAGTISVSLAPDEIDVTDSHIISAGKSGVVLGKFKFTASGEELKLTKARFRMVSASDTVDVADNVVSLSLYKADGTTLLAGPTSPVPVTSASTTDAYVDFSSIAANTIPMDGSATYVVKADLNTISAGADSGDELNITLDGNNNFEARGTAGSTVVTSTTDTNGNAMVVRKGQPKVELVSLPTTTLSNGTMTLMKFKVTAVDNDVALKHIDFQSAISASTVGITAYALRESGSTNYTLVTVATSGSATLTTVNVTLDNEVQIGAGNSKTFEFRGDVTGAASGNSIATKILGDTAAVTGELSTEAADQNIDDLDNLTAVGNTGSERTGNASAGDAAFNFIWSDVSAVPHNDTSDDGTGTTDTAGAADDWTNGRYIRVVPTDNQSVTFPTS